MKYGAVGFALAFLALPACGNAQAGQPLVPALEELAAQDNAEAIYHLGMAYHTGAGVPKNPIRALEAFRRAAGMGDVLASYKLGCYYDGQGAGLVQDDPALALEYKLVAAEAGYALAQQDVAALYAARGDLTVAITWLEKAMLQGWPDALAAYASVHNGADGIEPNGAKTAAYLRIFLDRTEASAEQRDWLTNFERDLSPQQRKQAEEIIRSYRAEPSHITLKALSGQRAAEDLVATH